MYISLQSILRVSETPSSGAVIDRLCRAEELKE